jgi:phosphoesterase RecJ-like protein
VTTISRWAPIVSLIREGRRFAVTTHVHPDGDALGAELALARGLRSLGKEVRIVNSDPVPGRYAFLDPEGDIERWRPAAFDGVMREADAVFVLDISRWERLGELGGLVREAGGTRVCIDHHPCEDGFGEIHIIDTAASATGELVYELLVALGAPLSRGILEPLYVAILTDTGGFRFSSTSPRAHEIAAAALRHGISPDMLHERLYEEFSQARTRLLGLILQNLTFECDGRLAHFLITRKMLEETGARDEETEGLVDHPRGVRGVQAVVYFMETEEGDTKISLRSRGEALDMNSFARRFGGGGHPRAAGIVLPGPIEANREKVLDAIRTLL